MSWVEVIDELDRGVPRTKLRISVSWPVIFDDLGRGVWWDGLRCLVSWTEVFRQLHWGVLSLISCEVGAFQVRKKKKNWITLYSFVTFAVPLQSHILRPFDQAHNAVKHISCHYCCSRFERWRDSANSPLRDTAHRIYQDILYFPNTVWLHVTRVHVIWFTPIRKERPCLQRLSLLANSQDRKCRPCVPEFYRNKRINVEGRDRNARKPPPSKKIFRYANCHNTQSNCEYFVVICLRELCGNRCKL